MIKRVAIEILGPEGIETKDITRRDIFYKNDNFSIMVEASDAETDQSITLQKTKMAFLAANSQNLLVNQSKLFELEAKTAGLDDQEIKDLLDKSTYGNSKIMSEADRDLEYLLDGKDIKPNKNANLAYKQRFVDYMKDHEEDMNQEEFMRITKYIVSLEKMILLNDMRERMLSNQATLPNPANNVTGAATPVMADVAPINPMLGQ